MDEGENRGDLKMTTKEALERMLRDADKTGGVEASAVVSRDGDGKGEGEDRGPDLAMRIGIPEIMARDIISVPSSASIREAAEVLKDEGISSVVVEEGGEIIGIVTDKDFVRMALLEKRPRCVGEIMSPKLVAVDSGASVLDAVKLMGRHGIRHLLVEEEGRL
jgi:CBS domain-containing protein